VKSRDVITTRGNRSRYTAIHATAEKHNSLWPTRHRAPILSKLND